MSNKIFGIHIGSKIQKFLKELDGDFLEIAKSLPRLCFLSGLTGEEMMMLLDAFPESGLAEAVFAAVVPNSADKPLQGVIEEIMGDHEMMSLCPYVLLEGARVMWGYVNRILGQPSLIRELSMAKFPLSGIVSRGTQKICNYTSAIGKSPSTMEEKSKFGKIILHPSLQRRIEDLASATANTKSHEAPFRNMLFYGPKIGMLQTTQL
ncbi:hypothetical protein L1887_40560 [Cichorium endivia]|nr:hypothetical protein L1887_40560 [Cichorium endivia]